MVKAQICPDLASIRRVIAEHLDELMSKRQEVKLAWGSSPIPLPYVIRGYEPPEPKGEYADTLWVSDGGDTVCITTPRQFTHFEILSTFRLTPAMAYHQMKEMEHAGGLG